MRFSSIAIGLMAAWTGAAAPADDALGRRTTTVGIPESCTTGYLKSSTCYTYTKTTSPTSCPVLPCPLNTALACPDIIVETILSVPCSTNCCPSTPTHYITTSCTGCVSTCVIPTDTSTVTTGCPTVTTKTAETTTKTAETTTASATIIGDTSLTFVATGSTLILL